MHTIPLGAMIRQLRSELEGALEASQESPRPHSFVGRKATLEIGFHARSEADGHVHLDAVPVPSSGGVAAEASHRLTLELELGSPPSVSAIKEPSKTPAKVELSAEPGAGGDSATISRRLELILGGGPGFTTGAKAEILADLLREFGRQAIVTTIETVWITQFDTGPSSSASVTKLPPDAGNGTSGTSVG